MQPIVRIDPKGALSIYQDLARDYIQSAKAPATLKAYRTDWNAFLTFCEANGLQPLPATAEVVALYLASATATMKVSTLERRLAAISQVHQAAGHESPTRSAQVRLVMQGIRRAKGVAPVQKAPAVVDEIRRMATAGPGGVSGLRDRAILLVGFASACRRSELVALDVEDLEWTTQGIVILIRRSKTDQAGEGRRVAVPYGAGEDTCPVRALRAWLDAAGITTGAIFRSFDPQGRLQERRLQDREVARIVKRHAGRVGLDPDRYAGHSLRSGLCTAAAAAGVEERVIMKQTGHRTEKMVRRYIREASLFSQNAASSIGL